MGKLIVISGLPASGKSTLINALKEEYNIIKVPEHNEWVKGKFPKAPNNLEEKIEKQRFFLNLDMERYKWTLEHKNDADIIISDTDFTSPLAHNFAERWLIPDLNIYNWMVDEYIEKIKQGQLGLADFYVYLDSSFHSRTNNRKEDEETTKRHRNDMFFTEPFPTDMRQFHYILMNEESNRKCLPAYWLDNNKDKDEAKKELWDVINRSLNFNGKDFNEQFFNSLKDSINDKH